MSERIVIDEGGVDRWVQAKTGVQAWLGPHHSLGFYRDSELAGAVVYDAFTAHECCMHLAIESPPVPEFVLRAVFGYPFKQLGLKRVTGLIRASNGAALALAERNGFIYEGRKRNAFGDEDEIIMGLLPSESPWL